MKDSIESIRKSSRRFFSGTLLSRISGMIRDISMAYAFGTDPAIALFMIAFRFAHLLRRLFGEGALQSAFVPEYEALRLEDNERARYFFRDLTQVLSLFLVGLIILSVSILLGLIGFCDLNPTYRSGCLLTAIMLPSLLFICLFGLNASFLQCEKSYFIPAVAPVAFNIVWIVTVLSLQHLPADEAMPWLSLGVVIACFSQWYLTFPQTKHCLKSCFPIRWSLLISKDLKKIAKPLLLGIMGVSATQINSGVDTLFAAFADPQGPAYLWYAMRLEQLPLALFGIALAGALLPPLSRAIKANQREDFIFFLRDAFLRTWKFMLFLAVLILAIGDECVNILYRRGDFSESSVIHTTQCLWGYGVGLIPSALILILAPACYAKSNYSLPLFASITALILNGLLNSVFIGCFSYGAESIAVATSISAWVNFFLLCHVLTKENIPLMSSHVYSQLISTFIQTSIAAGVLFAFRIYLGLTFFSPRLFHLSFMEQSISLVVQFCIFASIFWGMKSLYAKKFQIDHVDI